MLLCGRVRGNAGGKRRRRRRRWRRRRCAIIYKKYGLGGRLPPLASPRARARPRLPSDHDDVLLARRRSHASWEVRFTTSVLLLLRSFYFIFFYSYFHSVSDVISFFYLFFFFFFAGRSFLFLRVHSSLWVPVRDKYIHYTPIHVNII